MRGPVVQRPWLECPRRLVPLTPVGLQRGEAAGAARLVDEGAGEEPAGGVDAVEDVRRRHHGRRDAERAQGGGARDAGRKLVHLDVMREPVLAMRSVGAVAVAPAMRRALLVEDAGIVVEAGAGFLVGIAGWD